MNHMPADAEGEPAEKGEGEDEQAGGIAQEAEGSDHDEHEAWPR